MTEKPFHIVRELPPIVFIGDAPIVAHFGTRLYPRNEEEGEDALRRDLEKILGIYDVPRERVDDAKIAINEVYQNAIEYCPLDVPVAVNFLRFNFYLRLGIIANPLAGIETENLMHRDPYTPGIGERKRGYGTTLVEELSHGAVYLDPAFRVDIDLRFLLSRVTVSRDDAVLDYLRRTPSSSQPLNMPILQEAA